MHWPYKNSLSNHVCHPRQIQTYEVCQPGMLLIHCLAHFQQQQTVTPPQDGTFCDKCASWSWTMQRALLSLQPDVIAPELVQQGSTTSHESCLTKVTSLLAVLAIALPCHLLISTCRCMPLKLVYFQCRSLHRRSQHPCRTTQPDSILAARATFWVWFWCSLSLFITAALLPQVPLSLSCQQLRRRRN